MKAVDGGSAGERGGTEAEAEREGKVADRRGGGRARGEEGHAADEGEALIGKEVRCC